MSHFFKDPFTGVTIDKQISTPNIVVGKYSYYSGYYHGHRFEDCARFLLPHTGVDRLVIGSFCSICSGAAFIMAGNQGHRHDWASTFPFYWMPDIPEFAQAENGFIPAGDTVIGNDVWIGTEAMIMPGVTIGHGAIIGARALVTRDVEPYAIVGGNPATLLRKRFTEAEIALLLEMQWWDWPEEALANAIPYLCSANIYELYAYWQRTIRNTRH